MAYMDYMDLTVGCLRKAVKLNESLNHPPSKFYLITLAYPISYQFDHYIYDIMCT